MPRFAANLTLMFADRPFLERFPAAATAGFDAIEFLFPYEHPPEVIAGRIAAAGLDLALFNLSPGDWAKGDRGLAALPSRAAEFRASVDLALRYAAATGAQRLHVMAGLAPADDLAAGRAYREALRFACDKAGEAGLTILIEPINARDMPGYYLSDFRRAADLIAELDRSNLKLQFDVYHRQILHGDVLTGLREFAPIISHVQVASVPRRAEPNSGELNDTLVFEALDALGYAGFVGCEYRPAGVTEEGLGWFAPYRRRADSR
ncbi:2-oxo-tetronate isomerase [Hansschlegelia quercus]|uniref:Hydroxypyruvate isomerase family protein n=1 Tax=Hansschlegelia quercus TaxID=2528245 RepID=A0A4Q9GM35_9HYPH|nr:2-oxo-tetronate isomerase [Hansschlegelia quercus]TBN54491.1 hydroxypyruvate isomerase family protein [Hansschlegelia quercus]